jgi:hypothetical protein
MGRYFVFLLHSAQTGSEAYPLQQVPRVLSSGVKQPGRVANHPPPSSTGAMIGGALPSLPHVIMAQISLSVYLVSTSTDGHWMRNKTAVRNIKD